MRVARRLLVSVLLAALVLANAACRSTLPAAHAARFEHAAVAADHPVASAAGAEILRLGGNAVDAAVATSFTLSVVRPYSCGLGGGGFMIVAAPPDASGPAEAIAINYRETAPAAVGRTYYADLDDERASRFGPHAIGVPGTVAGLLYALERFGTLDRARVLAPAIRVAEEGFRADANMVEAVRSVHERLAELPTLRTQTAAFWRSVCHDGALAVGDRVVNHAQARALRLIARDGAAAFYDGPIGAAVVAAVQDAGGVLTAEDLAAYEVSVSTPLRGRFGTREVLAMPPPSSGGIAILQIFGMLERLGVSPTQPPPGPTDPDYVHLLTEAMKHAFADRSRHLADPAYVPVPTEALLAPAYLDERAARVRMETTLAPEAYGSAAPLAADGGTSHVSVIDANGMAAACTETINLRFGALVAVPGYGFMLNDEMDDFTTIPGVANAFDLLQSERNAPQPGKRPLSSMSPTIVLENGRAELVAGASSGPRIITGTLQCILNCLVFGMTPPHAVAAARFHHQWQPNTVQLEEAWDDTRTITALQRRGHAIARRRHVGYVQIVHVRPDGVWAASDPRKGGAPAGY